MFELLELGGKQIPFPIAQPAPAGWQLPENRDSNPLSASKG